MENNLKTLYSDNYGKILYHSKHEIYFIFTYNKVKSGWDIEIKRGKSEQET